MLPLAPPPPPPRSFPEMPHLRSDLNIEIMQDAIAQLSDKDASTRYLQAQLLSRSLVPIFLLP